MTVARQDPESRAVEQAVRDRVSERTAFARRPALVEDAAGGDPIVYDDEPEGAASGGLQHQRP